MSFGILKLVGTGDESVSNMPRTLDAGTIQSEMIEYFFLTGLSIRAISDGRNGAPHKIKRRTLSDWIQWYLTWDCPPAHNRKLLNLNYGSKVMDEEECRVLRRFVLEHPTLYLDEVQNHLHDMGLPFVSISTLNRYLHSMNLSHRKLLSVARERCEIRRAQYLQEISRYAPEQLVFVDETQKKLETSKRQTGWAVQGSHARVLEYFMRHDSHTFSLIAAADMNGFIPEAMMPMEKAEGNITGDIFIEYLRNFLLPVCNSFVSGLNRSVIVLDNATVHPPQQVENLCAEYGVHVVWTAPYSPDLNPIEYFFRVYKASMRRLILVFDEQTAHYMASGTCLDSTIIRNVYAHVGLLDKGTFDVLAPRTLVEVLEAARVLRNG